MRLFFIGVESGWAGFSGLAGLAGCANKLCKECLSHWSYRYGAFNKSFNSNPIISDSMRYKKLTHKIISCAMKVHNTLGNGFQEIIYQRCLNIEFKKNDLFFVREQEIPIFYDKIQVGTRRADFLIEDKILLEIKAIIKLEDVHLAQALNYLQVYDLRTGLLINFGNSSLEFKRLFRK